MLGLNTIDVDTEATFSHAVGDLKAGLCIGIRPLGRTRYLVLDNPSPSRDSYGLKWDDGTRFDFRTNILTERFDLVIVDHRDIVMEKTVNDRIKIILSSGNKKIPAIKEYRRLVGCGLKVAKEAVEAIMAGKDGSDSHKEKLLRKIDH